MEGGIKLIKDEDIFSFELNESLYFNTGQEILEMINISLEPEISIQPFNDYISIRGVIELQGEYLKTEEEINDEDSLSLDDYHFRRYIERIEDVTDDRSLFSHRFPVEISVPTYRVEDIDNVSVSIETFDYEIPSVNELKLKSSIAIYGITKDNNKEDNQLEAIQERNIFEFDIKETEDKSLETMDEDLIKTEQSTPLIEDAQEITEENIELSEDQQEKNNEKERWKYKEKQTLSEFFDKKQKDKKSEAEQKVQEEESTESEDIKLDEVPPEEVGVSNESLGEVVDNNKETEESILDVEAEIVEDISYLSDMFRGEEDLFTQVRVCIVQEADTLEKIAERYKVSTLQILNENRLEDEHLSEGQLLNIPQKQK